MGRIIFDPKTLADSLSETAGYKAGLALSLDSMCGLLDDTGYVDLLRESELQMVGIRAEDYEELYFKLLHRIGYTDEEYDGDYTGAGLFHKYRGSDLEKVHQRVTELFVDIWPKLIEATAKSGGTSIDPTPFIAECANELGSPGLDMAMERLEAINRGLMLSPRSALRYTEWRSIEQLEALFSGKSGAPEYGVFIDQRFINFLNSNPDLITHNPQLFLKKVLYFN